uniref:Uncharacterized protein n=1 Tax=Schistosoma japonicum TaxID=6182 RepID=Q5C1T0_SCHJA|nr:unknown [Schistosoma japonicum]
MLNTAPYPNLVTFYMARDIANDEVVSLIFQLTIVECHHKHHTTMTMHLDAYPKLHKSHNQHINQSHFQ